MKRCASAGSSSKRRCAPQIQGVHHTQMQHTQHPQRPYARRIDSHSGHCGLARVLVYESEKSVETDLNACIASLGSWVVLAFENEMQPLPQEILDAPEFLSMGVVVSNVRPSRAPLGIEDANGEIARRCRVIDPLGGGRQATPALVLVRNREVSATVLLGRAPQEVLRTLKSWAY